MTHHDVQGIAIGDDALYVEHVACEAVGAQTGAPAQKVVGNGLEAGVHIEQCNIDATMVVTVGNEVFVAE